jgi:hypothetical protein
MLNFLQNIRFFRVVRDIGNYIYLISKVRKMRKSREWAKLRLQNGWFYQIGTVINMRKEDFGEPEDVLMNRVLYLAQPIFAYIQNNNLGQVVKPKLKRFGNNYAYIITFWPLFLNLTFTYIVSRTLFIYLFIKLLNYLQETFHIYDYILKLFK